MFCPQCKAEYRDGFVRCTDCGVALQTPAAQARVEAAIPSLSQPEASAVLWRGQDPVSFSVLLSALDDDSTAVSGESFELKYQMEIV